MNGDSLIGETMSFLQNTRIAPIVVSALVIAGFVTVLVLLIVKPIVIDEKISSLLQILTGALSAKFGDVVQYNIGSSSGSKEKDDLNRELLTKGQQKG